MKDRLIFRQTTICLVFLLLLVLAARGALTAHAAGGSFNYWLTSDQTSVEAIYNAGSKRLSIIAHDEIPVSYNRWKAMAQKINPNYFGASTSWDAKTSEDDMTIVVLGNLKLCGTEEAGNGLFRDFSGRIIVNNNAGLELAPNVTDISYMFAGATQFNEPLNFDTSNVVNMSSMFSNATAFNQPVNFDTSSVKNMSGMFSNAITFDQPVNFDTHNVTDMSFMFDYAQKFNQPVAFDTSNVTDMRNMFCRAISFDQSVDFDTGNAKFMSYMFSGATAFRQPIFFNISSASNIIHMFNSSAVEQVVLRNNNGNQNVEALNAFKNCPQLYYLSFSGLKATTIEGFSDDYFVEVNGAKPLAKNASDSCILEENKDCRVYLQSTSTGYSDFKLAADCGVMAHYESATKTLKISGAGAIKYDGWVAMVRLINRQYFYSVQSWGHQFAEDDMKISFSGQPKAIKLCGTEKSRNGLFSAFSGEISFNDAVALASDVSDTSYMFSHAEQFNEPVDFDTANITSMESMFHGTKAFKQPIFFDIRSARNIENIFNSSAVEQVVLDNDYSNQNVESRQAFKNCSHLKYLSFYGLKNAMIDGFGGDYYVYKYGEPLVARAADQPYQFTANRLYRVYLQSVATGYSGYKLSADGGVMADYNSATKTLTIYGAGVVKYDGWVEMARLIDARYYGFNNSWDFQFNEDDMKIVFFGQPKAIKLCGTEKAHNGLFSSFSGTIEFNDAVSLAPAVTDLSYMFKGAYKFNEPVDFDTSSVTNMKYMFDNASDFNQPVNFDTHNATNMKYMFAGASSFNQPLNFDTSKVTNMSGMFQYASAFNQPVDFDTRKVKFFSSMFSHATSFNHPIFFNIISARDVSFMFYNSKVEQVILHNIGENRYVESYKMFDKCTRLKYLSFRGLRSNKIDGAFDDYYVYTSGNSIEAKSASDGYSFPDNRLCRMYLQSQSNFKLSADGGVRSDYNTATKKLQISGAGVVKYDGWVMMAKMVDPRYYTSYGWKNYIGEDNMQISFSGQPKAIKLCGTEQFSNGLFTSFSGQIKFNNAVDLAPGVKNTSYMFYRATAFNQPVNFDTSSVIDMSAMFLGTSSFKQPVNFDTSNLRSVMSMFNSSAVEEVVLHNDNGNQNIRATHAFNNCSNLKYLAFSGLKTVFVNGLSADYYVEENGGTPIAMNATSIYNYVDNLPYRVYLRNNRAPRVSAYTQGNSVYVSWTAVPGVMGYEVYYNYRKNGPFDRSYKTSDLSGVFHFGRIPGTLDQFKLKPYSFKVRTYIYYNYNNTYAYGPFSNVALSSGELRLPGSIDDIHDIHDIPDGLWRPRPLPAN